MGEVEAQRTACARIDLGDYYLVDERHNHLLERHVDVEAKAREMGAPKPWEYLAREEVEQPPALTPEEDADMIGRLHGGGQGVVGRSGEAARPQGEAERKISDRAGC